MNAKKRSLIPSSKTNRYIFDSPRIAKPSVGLLTHKFWQLVSDTIRRNQWLFFVFMVFHLYVKKNFRV
jgi:hypothetical protein